MGKTLNNLLLGIIGLAGGIGYLFYFCDNDACRNLRGSITSSAPVAYDDGVITSPSAFLADIRQQGIIEQQWTMDDPPIGVRETTAIVEGEIVLFFEYAFDDAARADVESLARDGAIADGTLMHWGDDVHYFQRYSVIAVYIGSSQNVLRTLGSAFGEEVQ